MTDEVLAAPLLGRDDFAVMLRDARNRMAVSQEHLARLLGVSFATVNRWEGGRTRPAVHTRARVLGVLAAAMCPAPALSTAVSPAAPFGSPAARPSVQPPAPATGERRTGSQQLLADAARLGARDQAEELLERALAIYRVLVQDQTPDRVVPPASLTIREAEVIALLASGMTNRQIGERLGVSVATVERHIANLYRKLGIHSRVDATLFALRNGLTTR